MFVLTEDAQLVCLHQKGKVKVPPTQGTVTVEGRRILVARDPEGKPISGCPNIGVGIKPCTATLPVKEGYSDLATIEGRRICLDTVRGLTDGTPPGTVEYKVDEAGQSLVNEAP